MCGTVGAVQRSTRLSFGDAFSSSSSSGGDSDQSDDDVDECPLHSHVLSREQLVGVTAMACDGPRLLTGNAEGRVLFQDFARAVSGDAEAQEPDAQRLGAARHESPSAGASRFWYRPR